MTSLFIVFSMFFDLASSQKTFDNFLFKGQKQASGVAFSIYSTQYSNVDLIIIEKYDKSQKVYNKIKNITVGDLERAKGDTFHFFIPAPINNEEISKVYQIKFITKDRIIKIYNDVDTQGVFFSNPSKGNSLLTKKNLNIGNLSSLQKQALKGELKLKEQGFEVVKETNYDEIAYDLSIDQLFLNKQIELMASEEEACLFEEEHYKFRMINSPSLDIKLIYYSNTLETTWVELDDTFLTIFEQYNSVID